MMLVKQMQQYIHSLSTAIADSGSTSIAKELSRVAEALEVFNQRKLSEFAEFLIKAEEYERTGVVAGKATRKPAAPKAIDEAKVRAYTQQMMELLERSIDEAVTYQIINDTVKKMEKDLKAAELNAVAAEMGIAGKPATKTEARKQIEEIFRRRKQTFQRNPLDTTG